MTGLRYCPLHVTEFCGEMQGKFKVGLAQLKTRYLNHNNDSYIRYRMYQFQVQPFFQLKFRNIRIPSCLMYLYDGIPEK